MTDLLAEGHAQVRVQASPVDKAAQVLREYWTVSADGTWLVVNARSEDSPRIVQQLVAHELSVHQVVLQRQSLEDYFIAVTQTGADASDVDEDAHA